MKNQLIKYIIRNKIYGTHNIPIIENSCEIFETKM